VKIKFSFYFKQPVNYLICGTSRKLSALREGKSKGFSFLLECLGRSRECSPKAKISLVI